MLWSLFWTFLKIGFISFGGGYAMIPIIQQEVHNNQWMTNAQYGEAVAVAGMAPGPIAANSAIYIGYHTAGIAGAVTATAGIILPSILVILLVGVFFHKLPGSKQIKSIFYGLRPIVLSLILFSAFRLAVVNSMIEGISWHTWTSVFIFMAAFIGMTHYRVHPFAIIILSGLVGIAVYT